MLEFLTVIMDFMSTLLPSEVMWGVKLTLAPDSLWLHTSWGSSHRRGRQWASWVPELWWWAAAQLGNKETRIKSWQKFSKWNCNQIYAVWDVWVRQRLPNMRVYIPSEQTTVKWWSTVWRKGLFVMILLFILEGSSSWESLNSIWCVSCKVLSQNLSRPFWYKRCRVG